MENSVIETAPEAKKARPIKASYIKTRRFRLPKNAAYNALKDPILILIGSWPGLSVRQLVAHLHEAHDLDWIPRGVTSVDGVVRVVCIRLKKQGEVVNCNGWCLPDDVLPNDLAAHSEQQAMRGFRTAHGAMTVARAHDSYAPVDRRIKRADRAAQEEL